MAGLVLAGESIYMLPYMRKTFQTSMEQVFQLNSTDVGLLNTMFGILAVACYFPSGWLADRFSARRLLTLSLVATSSGGFLMLTYPSYPWLLTIHAFWGITSILTFWAALIKATRNWGKPDQQGRSFGLLDAGRGAIAAILASLATGAFAYAGSTEEGLRNVLLVYAIAPLVAGGIIWFVIPDQMHERSPKSVPIQQEEKQSLFMRVKHALLIPEVWLLAVIIFAAYLLFLGTYDFPAFAERTYDRSKTFGAALGSIRDWMRPIAALGAGFLADRIRASRTVGGAFVLLVITFGSLFLVGPATGGIWLLWAQVLTAGLAVFALRGIYFAMLEEIRIPMHLTGITVGIVSFIGFAPDVFAHYLSGWFVDSFDGTLGYRYYFGFLGGVAVVGLLATVSVVGRRSRRLK